MLCLIFTVADFQDQLQRLQEQLQKAQARANELQNAMPTAAPPEPSPAVDLPESSDWADEVARIEARVRAQTSITDLQQQLIEALLENQRLHLALEQERQHHARTRQSLITALGDALDTLKQRRRSPKPP
ncbi:hypothetical protein BRW62_05205 [Parathermosynechococcus lividus PCC 6715]|uniref:Uncharacterized protein n=1 Tax=Parathermosynechococcus lividus PCC 6715 TaxID=1917166 RepID=A0A2D2Q163_PARLV|nr:hypothetical protein BRW62_05205 [Thermostichus lividus PCC 6715]